LLARSRGFDGRVQGEQTSLLVDAVDRLVRFEEDDDPKVPVDAAEIAALLLNLASARHAVRGPRRLERQSHSASFSGRASLVGHLCRGQGSPDYFSQRETMQPIRQANLLEVNEFLVLDYIRDRGRTTRGEVERDLGISRASVSRIVKRLCAAGSVSETAGSSVGGGRPRDVLEYYFQGGSVLVADIGERKCRVALADLGGTIVRDFVRPTLDEGSAYRTLRALVREAAAEAGAQDLPVSSLVVGLPAIIDADTGVAYGSHWDFGGSDLVQRLAQDVSFPIAVENEANLSALAQAWRGLGRGVPNFALISIGTGVGGAVFANGQLIRGRHNAAGEVGFLQLSSDELHRPAAETTPSLERALGAAGIAAIARRHLAESDPGSPMLRQEIDPPAVFTSAEAGEAWGLQTVEEALDSIALAVIAVTAVVDPQLVILDGGVGRSLGPYVEGIKERVQLRLAFTPDIRVSELGPNSTVIGGVAAGLEFARQQQAPASALQPLKPLWHA
jgi:glucokinase